MDSLIPRPRPRINQSDEFFVDAACNPKNNDMTTEELWTYFFPQEEKDRHLYRKALEICAECPVIQDCLEYSYYLNLEKGVFGGQTSKRRVQFIFPAWDRAGFSSQRVLVEQGYHDQARRKILPERLPR